MDMSHWLAGATARRPDRVALETADEQIPYRELLLRAVRAAGALRARGARPGKPVALAFDPGAPFVEALHGCLLLGAPLLPIDPRLGEREKAVLLRGVEPVVQRSLRGEGAPFELPPPPAADAVAMVVPTSGTTGVPKPIELRYRHVRANTLAVAAGLGLGDGERWLCPLPLSHVGGLMVLLRSVVMATTAVLAPPPFDEDEIGRWLRDGEITVASLVPTQLQRLLDAGHTPGPALRRVLLGGGPMPAALLARARDAGWPVSPSYGMTQACSTICIAEPGDLHTAGRPLPGMAVTIAADGEILVSGPSVASLGSVRTGDLGRLDEEGRLTVLGRKSDLIITGGENVAPAEVEAVLAEHAGVAEAVVFARPDPRWGEAITALVVPRPGQRPDPAELREHCRARLAGFKVPKAIELVDALPRTESGKVRRRDLV
jgi:O-succinylbenzoic acid--CoA ligase